MSDLRTAASSSWFSFPPKLSLLPWWTIPLHFTVFKQWQEMLGSVDCAAAWLLIVLCPLRAAVDWRGQLPWYDDFWQAARKTRLRFVWHRTCFSSPRGSKSRFCYLTVWKMTCPSPKEWAELLQDWLRVQELWLFVQKMWSKGWGCSQREWEKLTCGANEWGGGKM